MRDFDFKLEKVLNYKKTVEDYKKSEYGFIQNKLVNEESKLDRFNRYRNHIREEKNLLTTNTKVGNLAMYNNYINDVTKKIIEQEEIVTETKKQLRQAEEEMIKAVQEKKIFEKLKENDYEEHLYKLKKQEEKQIDTIVSYKTSTQQ